MSEHQHVYELHKLTKDDKELSFQICMECGETWAEAQLAICNQQYEALMVSSRKTINNYRELLGKALTALKMSPMPDEGIFRTIEEISGALHE